MVTFVSSIGTRKQSDPPLRATEGWFKGKYGMEELLKEKVFMTIEEQIPLKEFEQWLYGQSHLLEGSENVLTIDLFAFNYNQKGALYEFRRSFTQRFDEREFMLWKIKENLRDLIFDRGNAERILHDFYYDLGNGDYPFVQRIGCYLFEIEDIGYSTRTIDEVMSEVRQDAIVLLNDIEFDEGANPDFDIKSFKRKEDEAKAIHSALSTSKPAKFWWQFWR